MTEIPESSDLAWFLTALHIAGYERTTEDHYGTEKRFYELDAEGGTITGNHENTDIAFSWSLKLTGGVGYSGFFCVFYFNSEGSLLTHGAWE